MIAVVAHTIAGSGNTTDVTTSSINTTGANFLVMLVSDYSIIGTPTISDSKSNSWTGLTAQAVSASVRGRFYYVQNATTGSGHTFTVSSASATYPSVSILALSGVKTSGSFDSENGTSSSAVNTIRAGTITPSENNEIVINGIAAVASTVVTIDQGFTISDQLAYSAGAYWGNALAYLIQTTATAVNPLWDFTPNTCDVAAVDASFKVGSATAAVSKLAIQGVG